jgi:ketosteroid isomerase-like protein
VLGLASALLLIGLARPVAAQETQDTTRLPESLRSARTSYADTFSKLDGAAAAAHFADDGEVDFQGQTIAGQQAVGGWFAEVFSGLSGLRSGASTFLIADDQVTDRASYVVVTTDGEQTGATETIWKRQEDGSWKIARMTVM